MQTMLDDPAVDARDKGTLQRNIVNLTSVLGQLNAKSESIKIANRSFSRDQVAQLVSLHKEAWDKYLLERKTSLFSGSHTAKGTGRVEAETLESWEGIPRGLDYLHDAMGLDHAIMNLAKLLERDPKFPVDELLRACAREFPDLEGNARSDDPAKRARAADALAAVTNLLLNPASGTPEFLVNYSDSLDVALLDLRLKLIKDKMPADKLDVAQKAVKSRHELTKLNRVLERTFRTQKGPLLSRLWRKRELVVDRGASSVRKDALLREGWRSLYGEKTGKDYCYLIARIGHLEQETIKLEEDAFGRHPAPDANVLRMIEQQNGALSGRYRDRKVGLLHAEEDYLHGDNLPSPEELKKRLAALAEQRVGGVRALKKPGKILRSVGSRFNDRPWDRVDRVLNWKVDIKGRKIKPLTPLKPLLEGRKLGMYALANPDWAPDDVIAGSSIEKAAQDMLDLYQERLINFYTGKGAKPRPADFEIVARDACDRIEKAEEGMPGHTKAQRIRAQRNLVCLLAQIAYLKLWLAQNSPAPAAAAAPAQNPTADELKGKLKEWGLRNTEPFEKDIAAVVAADIDVPTIKKWRHAMHDQTELRAAAKDTIGSLLKNMQVGDAVNLTTGLNLWLDTWRVPLLGVLYTRWRLQAAGITNCILRKTDKGFDLQINQTLEGNLRPDIGVHGSLPLGDRTVSIGLDLSVGPEIGGGGGRGLLLSFPDGKKEDFQNLFNRIIDGEKIEFNDWKAANKVVAASEKSWKIGTNMIGYADALVRMPTFLPTSEDAGFLPFLMAWFNVNRVGKRTKQKSSDEETTIDEWTVSASADFSARLLQNYFNAGDALTGWVDQLDHAPPIQPGYEHMDDGDWAFNELLAWVLTVSDNVNVSNRVVKSLRTGKYNVVQRIARTNAQSTARELPRWVGKKLTEEQQEEFAELLKKAGENDTVIMTYQLRADKMRELHELTDKADLAVLRRESPTKVKKLKRKMKQIIDENKNYEPLSIALNRSGGTHGREEQVAYFRFFRFFQNSTASYTRKVPGGSIQFLPSKPADEQAVLSRLADRARQADSKNPGRSDHPAGPVSAENIAARLESMRKPKTPYSPEVAKHYKRFMAGYKDRLLILLGLEKKLAESYSLTEKEKAVMEKFLSELHGALARKANDERQPSEIRVHVGNLRDAVGKLKEKVSQLTNNSDSLDQVAPKAA